jgi:hypothetical protein
VPEAALLVLGLLKVALDDKQAKKIIIKTKPMELL